MCSSPVLTNRAPRPLTLCEPAKWFAAYVTSRHEKKVQAQLAVQEVESFLPLYRASHRWKNRCTKMLELPLFPNYVFVHIPVSERLVVLRTPGVISIVCSGRVPAPLPPATIDAIRVALAMREVQPHPYLAIGNRVQIIDGPLRGMQGVLIRQKGRLRVVVALDEIMQSAAVEINADEVSAVGPPRLCVAIDR